MGAMDLQSGIPMGTYVEVTGRDKRKRSGVITGREGYGFYTIASIEGGPSTSAYYAYIDVVAPAPKDIAKVRPGQTVAIEDRTGVITGGYLSEAGFAEVRMHDDASTETFHVSKLTFTT